MFCVPLAFVCWLMKGLLYLLTYLLTYLLASISSASVRKSNRNARYRASAGPVIFEALFRQKIEMHIVFCC